MRIKLTLMGLRLAVRSRRLYIRTGSEWVTSREIIDFDATGLFARYAAYKGSFLLSECIVIQSWVVLNIGGTRFALRVHFRRLCDRK